VKFYFKDQTPDIPKEVLRSQQLGELVFFCGAGVSYKAGLPTFGGLVENIYASLSEEIRGLELTAFKSGQFDQTLELLESRLQSPQGPFDPRMRHALVEALTLESDADLSLHNAILQLAATKMGKLGS